MPQPANPSMCILFFAMILLVASTILGVYAISTFNWATAPQFDVGLKYTQTTLNGTQVLIRNSGDLGSAGDISYVTCIVAIILAAIYILEIAHIVASNCCTGCQLTFCQCNQGRILCAGLIVLIASALFALTAIIWATKTNLHSPFKLATSFYICIAAAVVTFVASIVSCAAVCHRNNKYAIS